MSLLIHAFLDVFAVKCFPALRSWGHLEESAYCLYEVRLIVIDPSLQYISPVCKFVPVAAPFLVFSTSLSRQVGREIAECKDATH